MQPKLKRAELDRIAGHYGLDARGVDALLEIAEARPGASESLKFLSRMFAIGGLLSLAAGVVFFVAANWSAIAVFGRFALLEMLLLACVIIALFRLPPSDLGRGALFLAFVVTGALLALFGQTYQTGADVYELFLTWALLGLPLVVLVNWGVSSAAWLLVLNISLMLFCGWHSMGGWLWGMLSSSRFVTMHIVLAAMWCNLLLWFGFEAVRVQAVPQWVRRLAMSCAFAFGTWAGMRSVYQHDLAAIDMPGLLTAMVAVATYCWHRREDIYPLAVVMGTFIIVSVAWIADVADFDDEIGFIVLALWLIGTSAVAGRILTVTARRWRTPGIA